MPFQNAVDIILHIFIMLRLMCYLIYIVRHKFVCKVIDTNEKYVKCKGKQSNIESKRTCLAHL